MQIYIWHNFYPDLVKKMIPLLFTDQDREELSGHQYGSWKDLKYLCNYLRNRSGNHPLIQYCIDLGLEQLRRDTIEYDKYVAGQNKNESISPKISLVSKWLPREKSKKFGWLHARMAYTLYPEYLESAKEKGDKSVLLKAKLKCKINFTKHIVMLNKFLDTTQIKQCSKNYANIDYNRVTSLTMHKQKLAFQNKTKKNIQRSADPDRVEGAKNFKNHLQKSLTSNYVKVHGKRCNVYELVKAALMTYTDLDKITVNQQWKDNGENNNCGLGNIIPMVDTSGSMEVDECIPLYNAIGLGIRVSEKTNDAFKNRILSFDANPSWIQLNDNQSFVEKVQMVKSSRWGMNTDFYKAMRYILDVILVNNISPNDVSNMVLAVFSDMQIDSAIGNGTDKNTMMENIKNMYHSAGMVSQYKRPYNPPHILFWNLRSTTGFPTLSTEENVSMLSGYNSTLLNVFVEKGLEGLKKCTPANMLFELLNHKRYNILNGYLKKYN
tara:strand:- start:410 stop:1888 length:1479 start_codon:yes stop_codon:yes gene_type:complete